MWNIYANVIKIIISKGEASAVILAYKHKIDIDLENRENREKSEESVWNFEIYSQFP